MTSSILRIQLLGGFNLVHPAAPITSLNTPRLQSLLAYLILHADSPQARPHLAFVLWPDTSESHARNNLRQFLYLLRQALPTPDRFVAADANTVRWKMDEGQVVDVLLFESALREADALEARGETTRLRQTLARGVSYYQGDLLPGCYDDWITPERQRLRQQCRVAYQKLVHVLEAEREYTTALQTAQALLALDPLDEATYISLIRLHVLSGDRPGARRVYQRAVETLQRELGVEPGEALRAAYERLGHSLEAVPSPGAGIISSRAPLKIVGRQEEWLQLQEAWHRAASGDVQFALVTGEAGMGKSRLAEELFNWVRQQGITAAHTRSYAAEGRLSLAPVTDWLRSAALRLHFASLDKLWLSEVARLLPELLTERTDLARPEPIREYGARQRFFEALARAVLAAPRPTLLWIDDLQWCDPETFEWLHFFLRFEPHSPILILGTARSDESAPDHPLAGLARQLRSEGRLSLIELSPLDAAETAKLATQIEGHELDTPTTVRLYRETEGNPLFVVETVRAGIGGLTSREVTAAAASPGHALRTLPPRVHAVIAERLAKLSPAASRVAELGAAIGRAFPLDLLQDAGNEDEESIVRALDELWQKRIVREHGANLYDFTHDKLREVAYVKISTPQRRLLHRRIAQALERLNEHNLDPVSAQIAAHYEQAGLLEPALPYYQRAGAVAADMYANEDAINLLTRGLALLAQLSPGGKHDTQELAFLLVLAPLYRITKGWAAPEVERLATRALILSATVGTVEQRVQALWVQQTVDVVAARFEQVLQTDAELHRLAGKPDSPPLPFIEIHYAGARFLMGEFAEAREIFERMLEGRNERFVPDLQFTHGVNYLAHTYVWNSHALWCLGYPQKALESCHEGLRVAQAFGQPFNQALTLTYFALLQELRADVLTFRANAQEAELLTREFNVRYYYDWATILVQFARAWQQPSSDILSHLQEAIRTFRETGARIRLPYYLSLLARAYHKADQPDDGVAVLDAAFAESREHNERWWDAELYRLRGELILSQGAGVKDVEAAFRQAIEIAQTQQAKSLELRAAMSLARLWHAHGRASAARDILIPLYAWFTEGFDTPDLQMAQALMTQLERD